MRKKNILFVHQSAELYGSDKVLLNIVAGIYKHGLNPIVLLPEDGPLMRELRERSISCHIVPVTKISRAVFSVKGLLLLPFEIRRSLRAIDKVMNDVSVDVVYSNTIAVLSGALWARKKGLPHVWHVHEIILSPRIVSAAFPRMVNYFSNRIVSISKMVSQWLISQSPSMERRITTISNGIGSAPALAPDKVYNIRQAIGAEGDSVVISLVGRINRWKGHGLLLDAIKLLPEHSLKKCKFLMVGSAPPGQDFFVDDVISRIKSEFSPGLINVMPFNENIWNVWHATDIAVVPSTEPEPFGLVAIEAMAAAKPVVAAGHGGLIDIVVDGETGRLFEPNSALDLAASLNELICDKKLRSRYGAAGEQRQRDLFSIDSQVIAVANLMKEITE